MDRNKSPNQGTQGTSNARNIKSSQDRNARSTTSSTDAGLKQMASEPGSRPTKRSGTSQQEG